MAVTVTQLRAFLAVVRTGSVRAAAAELVVTQPSVSAAIAALSRELGAELTERAGRSVRPSAAGEAFAPYAAHVVGLLAEGEQAVREVSAGESRELRIAAVTTAAEHLLPALLGGFTRGNPGVRLAIDVGNRERVFRRLAAHEADVAIAGRAPPDAGLVSARFRENTMVVITQPGDPLAAGASVDLAELADRTWLLREEGSGTRAYNEALIARLDLRPRILTLGSNGAIKAAVRAGLGVAALSRDAVALELDAHLLVTVAVAGLPQREWFAHRASVGPVRPAVAEFLTYLERCG
jgi:LysR family transcriptional regulator, low CO2-responsive transcriptional regulator